MWNQTKNIKTVILMMYFFNLSVCFSQSTFNIYFIKAVKGCASACADELQDTVSTDVNVCIGEAYFSFFCRYWSGRDKIISQVGNKNCVTEVYALVDVIYWFMMLMSPVHRISTWLWPIPFIHLSPGRRD
jgi:hypothetical protein